MADEYILKISRRDPSRPLAESLVVEFAVPVAAERALVESFGQFCELLKLLKTPEKVAAFIKENSVLARNDLLIKEK